VPISLKQISNAANLLRHKRQEALRFLSRSGATDLEFRTAGEQRLQSNQVEALQSNQVEAIVFPKIGRIASESSSKLTPKDGLNGGPRLSTRPLRQPTTGTCGSGLPKRR
jgi:hypothetical protein